jgi:predicted nucleotidyltransferase component of viral defense system
LLDFPAPRLKVYSIESAIAEKYEAIVSLQLETSRMKDFYDIVFFAEKYAFKKELLKQAILTTFLNRSTDIVSRNKIYEDSFRNDSPKQIQWSVFLERNKLLGEIKFPNVIEKLKLFIEPIFEDDKLIWNPNKFLWE